ncbi:eCIS core domain-containing protein [Solimonas soli]|uniref:eCIS core domain-containing protein n=1 Tax=Solimonas soli TaxID=413479 RepID=UPI0004AD99CF|nr:DUF4157 domain-containing protein [Solimonas soli]
MLSRSIQASSKVSSPDDPAEREADAVARRVVSLPAPATAMISRAAPGVHRKALRSAPAASRAPTPGAIRGHGAGAMLTPSLRRFMEPRFGADFSGVRVHTDERAAKLSAVLSAQAFTSGSHIFFGKNQFQPQTRAGKELIAHELTHTVQQGAALQRKALDAPAVTQRTPRGGIFRNLLGAIGSAISDALPDLPNPLNYIADKANLIPGFRMFTIVLGVNPVNMSGVDRSAANIFRAILEFIPGASLISQALANYGIFDKIAGFAQQQIESLGMVGSSIKAAVDEFIASLSPEDILHLGDVWERAKRIFTEPIDRIIAFVRGLASGILDLIKEAILRPLGKLAEGTRAYPLLKAVLGEDPITGDKAEPDFTALIGGLMELAGQGEIWARVQEARAIPRIVAWFKGTVNTLKGFVQQIPALALNLFNALTLEDVVLLSGAFNKIRGVFGSFVGNFISWAIDAGLKLLQIVFDVVSPGAWAYVQRTGAALKSILKNPLPFVGNLAKAAKLGFQNFAGNFLEHLKKGLLDWLTGSLPGVYIPKALTLIEFGKLALSVFGISWAQIRGKIVKALGSGGELIMTALEGAFDVIVALKDGGPAAAWKVIQDKLTGLKDSIVDGITSFITNAVVTKAVPKLVAMFIPGAGFISAIISIYDMVMVFVEKIAKIIQVVTAFLNSIVAIAAGNIGAAAARVESILGGLLSLAISFLAGFAGLGKVADKVRGIIEKLRAKVDQALDTAINFIIGKAKALFASLFKKGKDGKPDTRTEQQKTQDKRAAIAESERLVPKKDFDESKIRGKLGGIKSRYKLSKLDMVVDAKDKQKETFHFVAAASPDEVGRPQTVPLDEDGRCSIKIARPEFRRSLKVRFRTRYPGSHVAGVLAENVDRRHIVSSDEMAKHYESVLNPMKWSEGKKRLVSKGTPVAAEPPKNEHIQAAAEKRHKNFFNELENLWPGDASENRSIGAARDPPPGWTQAAADAHAKQMYDQYGL